MSKSEQQNDGLRVVDHSNDRTVSVESKEGGLDKLQDFTGELDLELKENDTTIAVNWPDNEKPFIADVLENMGSSQSQEDSTEETEQEPRPTEPTKQESQSDATQSGTKTLETEPVEPEEPIEKLSHNPITFLKSVNTDFVNNIHGDPAISKEGFRWIQREFEISTESEVVKVLDEPLGCIVWAKAELPNGYSAEAHGEGYQFEAEKRGSNVSDNEFVRYADTRAKNRAISDLTSAGALAVSELSGDNA